MLISILALESLYRAHQWPIFTKAYDLNFFGVRVVEGVDTWNDVLGVWYTADSGRRVLEVWDASTDPGRPGLARPQNPAGTAIVAPGYTPKLWKRGLHHGKTPCLVQAAPIRVIRDGNRDEVLDLSGTPVAGMYAIQCHDGAGAARVGLYSLGCQVVRWPADLRRLLELLDLQEAHGHGALLSYGLVGVEDLIEHARVARAA